MQTNNMQVEGGIYMFGLVAPHAQDLLLRFQDKLAAVIKTAGGIEHRTYRAFRNAERESDRPYRFVDGELLERYLDQDEETQKEICQGLGPSVEDMRNTVEELRRMH
jgi:DNA damage-binding protein 1